jgi:hypothetical protein
MVVGKGARCNGQGVEVIRDGEVGVAQRVGEIE